MWEKLVQWCQTHFVFSLFVALVITVLSATAAPSLPMAAGAGEFFPKEDEEVKFWLDISERFGAFDLLMIGLEEPEGKKLSAEGLMRLAQTTKKLEAAKAEGILMAQSLTNVAALKILEDGALDAGLFMESIPQTKKALAVFEENIERDTQILNAFISEDMQGYIILLKIDSRKNDREIAQVAMNIVEENKGELKAFYFGAPFITNMITSELYQKLLWVVPLILLVVFGILYLRLRSILLIAFLLFLSGLPIVWWYGLVAFFNIPLSTSAINAILLVLFTAGVLFSLHLGAYLSKRGEEGNNAALLFSGHSAYQLAAAAVALGVLGAYSAPAIGSFAAASSAGLSAIILFGLLVFAPLAARYADKLSLPAPTIKAESEKNPFDKMLFRLQSVPVKIALGIVLFFSLYFAAQMQFFTSPQGIFAKGDVVGRALGFFDRHFKGSEYLQIHFKGDLKSPEHIARLLRMSDLLQANEDFVDVRSVAQVVAFIGERFEGVYRIPKTDIALSNLWFFLEGRADIEPLVNDKRDEGIINIRVRHDREMTSEAMRAFVEEAYRLSGQSGRAMAKARLAALRDQYGLPISNRHIQKVLEGIETLDKAAFRPNSIARLRKYLMSDESPMLLSDEEWRQIKSLLQQSKNGIEQDKMKALITSLESYKNEGFPPRVADEIVEMIATRYQNAILLAKGEKLTETFLSSIKTETLPEPFAIRAKGILTDAVESDRGVGELTLHVSGLPVLQERVMSKNRSDLFGAIGLMIAILALAVFLFSQKLAPTILITLAMLFGAALTFGLSSFFGIHADPSSASLYFLSPLLFFFILGSVWRLEMKTTPESVIAANALGLGFAAGFLALMLTGIMPIVRLGAILAISLLLGVIFTRFAMQTRLEKRQEERQSIPK